MVERLLAKLRRMRSAIFDWDPTKPEKEETSLTETPNRVFKDILDIAKADSNRIFVVQDTKNLLMAHTVIVGSKDTPYEGGFFYFLVKFPINYPLSPPKIRLMNTDNNSVGFNPNIYKSGRIDLDILYSGWRPYNTFHNVLTSIQQLMNGDAFYNSLGPNKPRFVDACNSTKYNDYLRFETIRVAVVDFMKDDNVDLQLMPSILRQNMIPIFKRNIKFYYKTILDNEFLDRIIMYDPFNMSGNEKEFRYELMNRKMVHLASIHQTEVNDVNEVHTECSDLSPSDEDPNEFNTL